MDAPEIPVERRTEPRAAIALPSGLRERIGQMVMVGFRGMTPTEAQPVIRQIADGLVGAVVMYDVDSETGGAKNIESRDQLRELNGALRAAGEIPVLTSLDAEGGFYHRLKEKHGFAPAIPASELGERNDLQFTRIAAGIIADELADVGIDLNLAPVVDVLNPANLTVSARRRNFAQDPAVVAAHAREFIVAHHERGILTTIKHFPGLGGNLRPYSPGIGEMIEAWKPAELEPYRDLMADGLVDSVLVTRVTHPELDADYPGCLSRKTVTGLLRGQLGYDGVVISDAMEMLAVWDVFGFERGTILAVNAGVDMLLFCNESGVVPFEEDRAREVVQMIMDAVRRGEISEERIDEACGRILTLKARRPD